MFGFGASLSSHETMLAKAMSRTLAIIEFSPEGIIIDANENFCALMGYTVDQLRGKHHRMFVDEDHASSLEYAQFWARLGKGEAQSGEFLRLNREKKDVYIRGSYAPMIDARGKVAGVVKAAYDVTDVKLITSEIKAKLEAISRVQAVIEFTAGGEILTANENFLNATGYRLDEIVGKHHRLFVDAAYAQSSEYAAFWAKLNRGEPIVATFHRIGKGGRKLMLQASYNPVFDLRGRIMKIVKYANDFSDLGTLAGAMSGLAAKDLETSIDRPFAQMFEPLRKDFNATQQVLRATMIEVFESVERVNSSGTEISTAASDLSKRTEQQAAALEETTATLDHVTETVAKTAERAREASVVASDAGADARNSGEIVRRAVDAMGRIDKSSQQIGQIIGVIDEIAFQTNLLALNAGVEAARAGEAGRGFAVVASEVRALAQRSAEAAKEIKTLISASTEQVGEGVRFVAETGEALTRIIAKVAQVNSLISNIASGAQEQATSLREVNVAVSEMDKAVQQNAAMAEEANAASGSMVGEAETLIALVQRFQLGRQTGSTKAVHLAAANSARPALRRA